MTLFIVYKITARHQLLEDTIEVRKEETESYNMAIYLNNCLTPIFLSALVLETASFYLYTNKVSMKKRFYLSFRIFIPLDLMFDNFKLKNAGFYCKLKSH